eukprot:6010803-Pyramimonas_sp.AAC.1
MGKRVVHVMSTIGKLFFADVLRVPPDEFDHGFVAARRREDAILGVQVVSWRLAQGGCSHMASLKDLSNAFACGDWSELAATVEQHARPEDKLLAKQRFEEAAITLPCRE